MLQAKLGDRLHPKRKKKNKLDYWCDLEGKASSPTTQQHASTSWYPIYSEIPHHVGWKSVNMTYTTLYARMCSLKTLLALFWPIRLLQKPYYLGRTLENELFG